MGKRKGYIFTNKKSSNRAVMAVILGIISLVSLGAVVFAAYRAGGEASPRHGITAILALIYSLTGLVLGIVTLTEKNYYRVVPAVGVLMDLAALGGIGLILYMGGYLG